MVRSLSAWRAFGLCGASWTSTSRHWECSCSSEILCPAPAHCQLLRRTLHRCAPKALRPSALSRRVSFSLQSSNKLVGQYPKARWSVRGFVRAARTPSHMLRGYLSGLCGAPRSTTAALSTRLRTRGLTDRLRWSGAAVNRRQYFFWRPCVFSRITQQKGSSQLVVTFEAQKSNCDSVALLWCFPPCHTVVGQLASGFIDAQQGQVFRSLKGVTSRRSGRQRSCFEQTWCSC